jgi:hypothetical protein
MEVLVTDTTPTDLTTLMSLDPMDLTKQDLDRIIAYQRKLRVQREGGAKTKKESGAPAVDIKALMNKVQTTKGPATKAMEVIEAQKPKPSQGGFVRRF